MTTQPITLNNGIYLETTEYSQTSHLDSAHVAQMNKGNHSPTHLGIIEPFITSGYFENPYIYNFANVKSTRIEVPGGMYSWEYPIAEEPVYVLEDMSGVDKPGIGGSKFKFKVNELKYDNGYILAPDPHSPEQILITEDEIIQEVDGWVVTARYYGVDPANRWYPKQFLRRNTKLFPVGTVETEYSKTYSSIPTFGGGTRKYMNMVGQTHSQLHYEITRDAAYSMTNQKCVAPLDMAKEVIQMYRFRPGSLGHGLQGQEPKRVLRDAYIKAYGKNGEKRMQMDIVQKLWIPKIEALGIQTLEMMREMKAIWGAGGPVNYDGKTQQVGAVGLFHQLNMGNQYTFNLFSFSVGKLENIIAERLRGRVTPFNNNTVTTIKVGTGMYALLRNQLTKIFSDSNAMVHGKDISEGLGSNKNRGVSLNPIQVTSWNMLNGYGVVRMEVVPGLDPKDANSDINPMITVSPTLGAHRLSSYMIIIDDITNSEGGNICELVYKDDWDINCRVKIGKLNYMGAPTFNGATGSMFVSSSDHPGYEVIMTARDKAYWVKDITKSLLIKPINPMTGKPIYDPVYRA